MIITFIDIKLSSSWQVRVRHYRRNNKESIRKQQIVQDLFHVVFSLSSHSESKIKKYAQLCNRGDRDIAPLSHGDTPQLELALDWRQVASHKGSSTRRKLLYRRERNNSIWAPTCYWNERHVSDKMAVFTTASHATKVAVKFLSIISIIVIYASSVVTIYTLNKLSREHMTCTAQKVLVTL